MLILPLIFLIPKFHEGRNELLLLLIEDKLKADILQCLKFDPTNKF